jgi:hypothetical protein
MCLAMDRPRCLFVHLGLVQIDLLRKFGRPVACNANSTPVGAGIAGDLAMLAPRLRVE